jgi:hypothetical protein
MSNEIVKQDAATITVPEGSFNTVDISTFEGAAKLTNAINNSQSLAQFCEDNGYADFVVVDIVVTPGVRKSRDGGEDTPCEDTRLILEDGTSLLSQSGGIARSARFVAGFLGEALHDGIIMHVVEQKLRNGNTIKNLEVVGKNA